MSIEMGVPKTMQAVQLDRDGHTLTVRQVPVPQPARGQVLVRMVAAPINPSDLNALHGASERGEAMPASAGYEGSGIVVAAGSGILPRIWLGRRVTCAAPSRGTWAEYVVTSATSVFPLSRQLSFEQGAFLIVNPMTALAFLEIARRGHHAAVVNNAAAGAVGRMMLRLGRTHHLPMIHIVRRQEQVALLRSLGAKYVLNCCDLNFYQEFSTLAHRLSATLILDPVGGEQTSKLLEVAPSGSTALVYGLLSGKRMENLPQAGNGAKGGLVGFYLPDWMAQRNVLQILKDMRQVQRLAANELQTTIQKRLPLSAVQQAIELYQSNPTAGKVLLVADPEKVRVDA